MTRGSRLLAIVWAIAPSTAFAQSGGGSPVPPTAPSFGYTTSTDTVRAGGRIGLLEPSQRLGRRDGEYAGLRFKLAAAYGALDTFTVGFATTGQYLHVDGVTGIGDRTNFVFEGFAFNAKVRLMERARTGVGLAFEFTPQWTPANPVTGAYRENSFIAEFKGLADFSIVENILAGAINVKYYPAFSRVGGRWLESSGTEIAAALAVPRPWGSVGVEVRRLTSHDDLLLGGRTNRAIYVGPTFAVALGSNASLSGGWGFQVEGRARTTPRQGLDLVAFERHQAILRLNFTF